MDVDTEKLLWMYRTMVRIRAFDSKVEELFLAGKIPGFVHLYIGEEAVASGVMANLRQDDYITSTHRGHGHCIAKGASTNRMMAEIFGKRTGYCKGKGGSMHIFDFSIGMLGANGVVGGGFPIATGAGLSIKLRGTDQVCVCFFGDGAANRGTFHESLNMAAAWKLPVIYVCENNQYASTSPFGPQGDKVDRDGKYAPWPIHSVADISIRAQGYGIPGVTVDGNDILAVYQATAAAVERARRGEGPTLLECKTYRLKGHFVGDPQLYRPKEEVEEFWKREPIGRFEKVLLERGVLTAAEAERIKAEAAAEIEAAVQFAVESPLPEPEEAMEDLFA